MGTAADTLAPRYTPLANVDPTDTTVLDALTAALAAPAQLYEDIFRDGPDHQAGEPLLDADLIPAALLPWLAQFPGVQLPLGADETTQRALIVEGAGLNRCQTSVIESAVRRTLSVPDGFVRVFRNVGGDRWAMTVLTRTAQTPDPGVTLAAALSQKPVGVKLELAVSDAPIWAEATEPWSAVSATWAAATVADVTT